MYVQWVCKITDLHSSKLNTEPDKQLQREKRRHQLLADCQITDNLYKGKKNQKSKSLAIGYPALNIIENI